MLSHGSPRFPLYLVEWATRIREENQQDTSHLRARKVREGRRAKEHLKYKGEFFNCVFNFHYCCNWVINITIQFGDLWIYHLVIQIWNNKGLLCLMFENHGVKFVICIKTQRGHMCNYVIKGNSRFQFSNLKMKSIRVWLSQKWF